MRIVESKSAKNDSHLVTNQKSSQKAKHQDNRQAARQQDTQTVFTRQELGIILNVYGQFVAAGEWRDYAIDCMRDVAIFSVFRHASEAPLYRIEKRPKLARKQGVWLVAASNGTNLRRGHELTQVLRVFDKQRLRLATS